MLSQAESFLPTGFPGFRILSLGQTMDVFGHELSVYQQDLPGLEDFLQRNAPIAVKLTRAHAEATAFSSAAYPECPQMIFHTELIRFHLPPNIVWSADRKAAHYPELENLVHEAIHHWWGQKVLEFPVWASRLHSEIVRVSWRSEAWTLDKALHAGLVYLAAQELRRVYCADLCQSAQRAAAEIFHAVPQGPWTAWANASLGSPEMGSFLTQLGVKSEPGF